MTPKRERIVAAFESLKHLYCDLGLFAEGDETRGVYVRYWANRNLRQLTVYRDGEPDGFHVIRHGPQNPPHLRHLRGGKPFGESQSVFRSGQGFEHVLIDGDTKIDYTDDDAKSFEGYLTTRQEENLYQKYAIFPIQDAFIQ